MKNDLMGKEQITTEMQTENIRHGIHVVAKPVGPLCNLNCEYCFYLEKHALFAPDEQYRMSDDVLFAFITNYITSQPTPVVEFVWQGGEPTLLGIDFFMKVVELQKPFAHTKTITNSLQTNGTLLTDEWCRFLKQHNFMVGISIDGPRVIHDRYRRDRRGTGSFDQVIRGMGLLRKHKVEFNVLVSVARETARHPLEVYRFLRDESIEFIQFAPVVERSADACSLKHGLQLACPPALDKTVQQAEVTDWSVVPEDYGDFLIAIYEEWVRHDVGKTFVMNFEWALNAWIGNPSPVCVHARQCGRSLVIEHNGDVYACDHCVYPEYRLGNVMNERLSEMTERSLRSGFGVSKETELPRWCRECDVLAACRGGCPKHRFAMTHYNEPGLHYLCEGYKKFYLHIRKYLSAMTQLLENGLSVSYIMDAVKGPLVIKMEEGKCRKEMKLFGKNGMYGMIAMLLVSMVFAASAMGLIFMAPVIVYKAVKGKGYEATARMSAAPEKVYAAAVSSAEEKAPKIKIVKKEDENMFLEVTDGIQTASVKIKKADAEANSEIIVTASLPKEEGQKKEAKTEKEKELALRIGKNLCAKLQVQCTVNKE
jgi:uncharacterized protein